MATIKTDLMSDNFNSFRFFLDANKLENIKIDFYSKKEDCHNPWIWNRICYSYDENDKDLTIILSFIKLKHKGLEEAFIDFKMKCKHHGLPTNDNYYIKRDMDKLDKQWEEKRKQLGLN